LSGSARIAVPGSHELCVERLDTLLLYLGSTLYAQQLLLSREHAEATRVLKELVNLAPPLLRATFDAWGYTRAYCLLEQLWLESYAGLISASRHATDESSRRDGVAMAAKLTAMLQGKVQCRVMRHTVAEFACELAPDAARPLLLKGEAMLDQPLAGHDESEAEGTLREALQLHRRDLAAADADADAQYWSVLARALDETGGFGGGFALGGGGGGGAREAEACALLGEAVSWLPDDIELYLQLGALYERADPLAAIELYASYPPPKPGDSPSFNHAVLANSAVRLLIDRRDFGSPHMVPQLVTVGKVLGVLNIEKHVQVLDAHNQVETIKEVYEGILPDFDQSAFFRQKGWII
jgi:tetratricopeptide (TPR) repeat protein